MATSTIQNSTGMIPTSRVSVELANSNVMSIVGGGVELFQLDDKNFLAFISLGIKYTSARSADMAAWKLQLDGTDLTRHNPYFISCRLDGTTTNLYSYSVNNLPYFDNPVAVSANQTLRWTGVVLYQK